jgi:putative ABC transport system permease protein
MRFSENAWMALKNLRSNKVRSFLTMLGIIIGVGAVITMVSLGDGAKRQITDRITAMGSNLLIVTPDREAPDSIENKLVPLLRDASDYIQAVAPAVRSSKLAAAGGNTLDTSILGCTPEYANVRNYQVAYGDFISHSDDSGGRRVAVIGSYVASQLFPDINPIGETVRIGGVRFEVIGVLTEKGQSGFGNADNLIIIPLTTAQQRITGNRILNEINIQVQDAAYVNDTLEKVEQTLLDALRDENYFNVNNMADALSAAEDMTKIMTMLLTGIAAVSLLVGGIGIMNIMLVSVTERIREIGIRKAIGAQSEEILTLFLIEAITLSLLGGVVGILFGGGLAMIIGKLVHWSVTLSAQAILIAFTFSVIVGLFFGVYPAYKASGLNPIEALRHE